NPYELIQQPLYSLVSKLMTIFHLEETDAFVSAFLENVLSYSQSNNGELSSFLDWWSQNEEKLSISMPDGIDAITVMTIHASKGLQFPVVILPCTQYKDGKTKTTFWYENPNYLQPDDALKLPFVQLNNNDELSSIGLGDYVEEEKNRTAIDNLNILYVAHTRPQNGLYIITGKQRSEGGRGNYNLFLDDFVQKKDLQFIQDEEDKLHFWYGDIDFKVTSNKAEQNQDPHTNISRFYTADFALPKLAYQGNMVERNRGNAVHDFLSKLKKIPKNETELDNMNFEGNPFGSDIKAALSMIMKRPDFNRLFGDEAQVLNEVSILTQDGDLKRPDRVVICSDKVFVIDYKTGSPSPKYQNQINEYVSLLEGLGYQNVEGILLYM
ncbi:MAG TPA: 3'-5' exonuclease, partial [Bacteroidales bacterium]|nr:3'-5' exonuclease [Bacteroidales bacterium]